MSVKHVGIAVTLRRHHPSGRNPVDAFEATVERRVPRASLVGVDDQRPVHHHDVVATRGAVVREPRSATFLAGLEQVRFSVHGFSHPVWPGMPTDAESALKTGIKRV